MVEVNNARCDFKRTIERIANECGIDISIKFRHDIPLVKVAGIVETIDIDEDGIVEPSFGNLPTAEDWDIFLTKLTKELER